MSTAAPHPIFPTRVSDHAVVRWLERVEGRDIEALRAEILNATRESFAAWGASAITIHTARVQLVMNRGVVTTVIPLNRKAPRAP